MFRPLNEVSFNRSVSADASRSSSTFPGNGQSVCVCVRARARARMHTWAFREGREQTEADREDWDVEAEGHPGTQDPR